LKWRVVERCKEAKEERISVSGREKILAWQQKSVKSIFYYVECVK
jgi:hypothetical protein